MSLPAELRQLCHQLTSTPSAQLPQVIPTLIRNVSRCQGQLRSGGNNGESSVLIHKLKTQISTLLSGKSAEGRFTAVVLIKVIVIIGGWEVLRGAESWVRGLLSVLGKQEPLPTQRLCILSLTTIYLMTHQYQSLVRELTTPTLPNFVSLCLSLIFKLSAGPLDGHSLMETIFESFCVLVPRYPTIFRPYNNQIKAAIRGYLAPTQCDRQIVPQSLSESARCLAIFLYQTAAKNTSGEEWSKGIRALVKDIHGTIDQVYRAVIEDWESTAGYISQHVDINQEVQGGAKSEEDLPAWKGIDAGVQRLVGMLRMLREHFKHPTVTAVTIPIDAIVDLITRLVSVVSMNNTKGDSGYEGIRMHPAIERNERDGLWAGLENVHVASLDVYLVLFDRLQHNYVSLAQRCLSQVTWAFSWHLHDEAFRSVAYQLIARVLPYIGSSLDKSTISLLTPVIRACCKDFPIPDEEYRSRVQGDAGKPPKNGSSGNPDTILNKTKLPEAMIRSGSAVHNAAMKLLPILLLHLPQQHLQGYLRAKIDQTAILARHSEAMLASVLNPYIVQNGRSYPSILPHLCREFSNDPAVEALLRPRLPVLRQGQGLFQEQQLLDKSPQEEDDVMEDVVVPEVATLYTKNEQSINQTSPVGNYHAVEDATRTPKPSTTISTNNWDRGSHNHDGIPSEVNPEIDRESFRPSSPLPPLLSSAKQIDAVSEASDEGGSDESVHLIMDLSESEDEGVS